MPGRSGPNRRWRCWYPASLCRRRLGTFRRPAGRGRRRRRSPYNNRCVRTSSTRAWATIRFVNCRSSSKEVPDEHGMWLGSASAADHLRRDRHGVGGGVAGPGVAARPRPGATLATRRRRSPGGRSAGSDGGGGLHWLAVCGRGDTRRRVRGARRRAGRRPGEARQEAPRQDRSFRRPVVARVVAAWRAARVVDPAGDRVGVAGTSPALQVVARSAAGVDPTDPRRVVPARRRRSRRRDPHARDASLVDRRQRRA